MLKRNIINKVQNVIFDNINITEKNDFFLSYVNQEVLCIFSKRESQFGNFFTDDTPDEMNFFFKNLTDMLLNKEVNGDGCFDYENDKEVVKNMTIKDKANKYFSSEINLILIKVNKEITPVSFFSLSGGFIWNLCSSKNHRKKGYMTILIKHFLSLVKNKEIKANEYNSLIHPNKVDLFLLKKNPSFDTAKQFYLENGFKTQNELDDRLVLYYEF